MTKEQESEKFKKRFGDNPSFDGRSKDILDLLKFCSSPAVMNMARWNKWRKNNPNIEINLPGAVLHKAHLVDANLRYAHLEGANFKKAHLEGADFTGAWLNGAHSEGATFSNKKKKTIFNNAKLKGTTWSDGVHLEGLDFRYAEFQETNLHRAHFEGADLYDAHFEKATLTGAIFESKPEEGIFTKLQNVHFNGAILTGAIFDNSRLDAVHFEPTDDDRRTNLRDASFKNIETSEERTYFKKADMNHADLTGANLWNVSLEDADLHYAILEGTSISEANLKGADLTGTSVNGRTKIQTCDIDGKTNFNIVNLDSIGISPSILAALKTNVRRISWIDYYKDKGEILTSPMRFFWCLSDYGSSSLRIGLSILIATLFFTDVYLALVKIAPDIFTLPDTTSTLLIGSPFHDYIRVLCFAISTMVTLGFGGINIKIISGHNWLSTSAFGFVTLNLISGYLFLSVLVTRFGILFESQAPEQKTKETNNTLLYFVALMLLASSSYMLFCWENMTGFINYVALVTILFMMPYYHFK